MTRRDWLEKLRVFKETKEKFPAALQEREIPENIAVIDSFHSLLSELVANPSLFNGDDQAFIVQTNLAEKLRQFKEISIKYDTFLQGRENPDDDLSVVGNSFNSLLSELLSNLNLFNPEDRAYIETAKNSSFTRPAKSNHQVSVYNLNLLLICLLRQTDNRYIFFLSE